MKTRIRDPRLVEILDTRACSSLPAELCHLANRAARKLLAARDWGDIFVPVAVLDDLYAIHIHGKWVIVFHWVAGEGARDLSLRRV